MWLFLFFFIPSRLVDDLADSFSALSSHNCHVTDLGDLFRGEFLGVVEYLL